MATGLFNKGSDQSRIQDPGFGEKLAGKSDRLINKDGSFNVKRKGGERGLRVIYQYLLSVGNFHFFMLMLLGYVVISLIFAVFYFFIGVEHLIGVRGDTPMASFMDCFNFRHKLLPRLVTEPLLREAFWPAPWLPLRLLRV